MLVFTVNVPGARGSAYHMTGLPGCCMYEGRSAAVRSSPCSGSCRLCDPGGPDPRGRRARCSACQGVNSVSVTCGVDVSSCMWTVDRTAMLISLSFGLLGLQHASRFACLLSPFACLLSLFTCIAPAPVKSSCFWSPFAVIVDHSFSCSPRCHRVEEVDDPMRS